MSLPREVKWRGRLSLREQAILLELKDPQALSPELLAGLVLVIRAHTDLTEEEAWALTDEDVALLFRDLSAPFPRQTSGA